MVAKVKTVKVYVGVSFYQSELENYDMSTDRRDVLWHDKVFCLEFAIPNIENKNIKTIKVD